MLHLLSPLLSSLLLSGADSKASTASMLSLGPMHCSTGMHAPLQARAHLRAAFCSFFRRLRSIFSHSRSVRFDGFWGAAVACRQE